MVERNSRLAGRAKHQIKAAAADEKGGNFRREAGGQPLNDRRRVFELGKGMFQVQEIGTDANSMYPARPRYGTAATASMPLRNSSGELKKGKPGLKPTMPPSARKRRRFSVERPVMTGWLGVAIAPCDRNSGRRSGRCRVALEPLENVLGGPVVKIRQIDDGPSSIGFVGSCDRVEPIEKLSAQLGQTAIVARHRCTAEEAGFRRDELIDPDTSFEQPRQSVQIIGLANQHDPGPAIPRTPQQIPSVGSAFQRLTSSGPISRRPGNSAS